MSLKKFLVFALLLPVGNLSAWMPAWGQAIAPAKFSPGFARQDGVLNGATNGSYSLSSIAKFDRDQNPCLGFSGNTPDHKIVLEKGFAKLSFQVNSRGKDTTLIIKAPNGQIFCGDDTGAKKDASITARDLGSGEYDVWVGSIEPSKRWSYSLTISEK
jgi:hypothetical protein